MIQPTPKQARALALRRDGKKWREIAAELRTTPRYAQSLAERARIKEYRLARAAEERAQ